MHKNLLVSKSDPLHQCHPLPTIICMKSPGFYKTFWLWLPLASKTCPHLGNMLLSTRVLPVCARDVATRCKMAFLHHSCATTHPDRFIINNKSTVRMNNLSPNIYFYYPYFFIPTRITNVTTFTSKMLTIQSNLQRTRATLKSTSRSLCRAYLLAFLNRASFCCAVRLSWKGEWCDPTYILRNIFGVMWIRKSNH